MAKLRKSVATRAIDNAYTRKSKYRKKAFIRAVPNNKVVKFHMGDLAKDFKFKFELQTKQDIQLRHNCLEAARKSMIRQLEKSVGKKGFRLIIRPYPHHVLRENALASGAGADRLSTGMKMSFGKTVGIAARVFKGQAIVELNIDKDDPKLVKSVLMRASNKFPGKYLITEVAKKASN